MLNVQNNSALGLGATNTVGGNVNSGTTAPVVLAAPSGTLVGPGATLQLQSGVTLGDQITLDGGTLESLTGANVLSNNALIALNASSTIAVDVGTLTVNSNISGTFDLTKTGSGTLVLSGLNSVYTGQTNINAGIVSLTTATALGATTGSAIVASGATLQLNGATLTYAGKQAVLSGQGMGLTLSTLLYGTGALENINATLNTWTGNIVLNSSDATISNTAAVANTLTLTGAISGTGGLTKVGLGVVNIGGPDSHSGAVTVDVGTLTVNGVGQIINTSGVTVNPNAVLTLDNTGTNLTGRFTTSSGASGANLTLNTGTFNFLGNNTVGAATADALGTVAISSGASFIDPTSGTGVGSSSTLTIGTLTRLTGATVSFVPGGTFGINSSLNTPANRILITTLGSGVTTFGTTLNNVVGSNGNTIFNSNILPWATIGTLGGTGPGTSNFVQQYDFVTLSGSSPISVAAYSNYKTSIAAAGPTDIVKLTASETMTANKVVGAHHVRRHHVSPAGITVTQANFTLGVASGAIMSMGNNTLTFNGGTIDFGSAEGILNQNNANLTVNSSLTGTGGLTVTNTTAGAITLGAANSYTGTTTLNNLNDATAVSLTITTVSAFSNGPVNFTSGQLANSVGANFALANPFNFNNSVVTLGVTNRIFLAGPITLTGNNQITVTNPTFFSGVVSGPGSLNDIGGNALVMQNPNSTYSGGTNVGGTANLQFNSSDTVNGNNVTTSGPLGTGAITFAATAPVFQNGNTGVPDYIANAVTLHNAINLINTTLVIGGPATTTAGAGGDITLAGTVNVFGTNTLTVAQSFNFTISGVISGTGSIIKNQTGVVDLTGANTSFSGGVTATLGTVVVGNNSALGTGVLTINGGAVQDDGLAPRTVSNNVILAAGTTSFINALNPSTPFTFTGNIGGTGGLTKGYASLTSYETTMNAVQTITFGSGITGGSFTLTVNGSPTGNISAVAAAITAASESGNTVTITATNTFTAGDTVVIAGVGTGYNGTFTVTGVIGSGPQTGFTYTNPATGLSTLGAGGTAFDSTQTAANIQTQLNLLPATIIGVYQPVVNASVSGATISITFQNISVGANVAAVPTVAVNAAALTGGTITSITPTMGSGNLVLSSTETYTGVTTVNHGTLTLSGGGQLTGVGATTNAVQTITFTTAATAGTFTLTLNGQTTAPIQYVPVITGTAFGRLYRIRQRGHRDVRRGSRLHHRPGDHGRRCQHQRL